MIPLLNISIFSLYPLFENISGAIYLKIFKRIYSYPGVPHLLVSNLVFPLETLRSDNPKSPILI